MQLFLSSDASFAAKGPYPFKQFVLFWRWIEIGFTGISEIDPDV